MNDSETQERQVTPHFEARIKISTREVESAGSLEQAVQNAIGASSAEVLVVLGLEEALL